MAIYLKKFETQAAYEAAQPNLILPNVSLTVDNNTVHYNPSSPIPPTPDGHLYVKPFNEYGIMAICDSLGKFVWFNVNGEKQVLEASNNEPTGTYLDSSYYLYNTADIPIEDYEPNSIASITDIQDIGGMTILGSLATNLGYSSEYEVVFDPLATVLTE
jgi:hypothetical protein